MKKVVSSRLRDIIKDTCERNNVLYKKTFHRRAKKFYLGLSFKDKIKALA